MSLIVAVITRLHCLGQTQANIYALSSFVKTVPSLSAISCGFNSSTAKLKAWFSSNRFLVNKMLHTVRFVKKLLNCVITHDCAQIILNRNRLSGLFPNFVKCPFMLAKGVETVEVELTLTGCEETVFKFSPIICDSFLIQFFAVFAAEVGHSGQNSVPFSHDF